MEHLSLLAGGDEHTPATRAQWEKAAADVLRKAGRLSEDDPDEMVWSKLGRTTLDGIDVPALGLREHLEGLPPTGEPGVAPYTRGSAPSRPEEGWDVRAHLADPDAKQAAADALTDLENGATSLWLRLGRGGIAVADLPTVLEKVYVDLAPVVLDCPDDPVGAAEAFCAILAEREVTPAAGTVLAVDPISASVRGYHHDVTAVVTRLAGLAREHHAMALAVDATVVHDHGGHDAHELGASLAAGAAYLRILTADGLRVEEAAGLIAFRYAVTDDQFVSIAKLRAARRLWARVLELSGAPSAPAQVQHAVSGRAMLTRYDPWVNMLRGTVAAFAAGVGGAAAVTVMPFDDALGLPDALGRRIARNTSSLLIHEAHVARVSDPAGGSFAVERLTDDIARAGWAQPQAVEADGGLVASLDREDGLPARVEREAAEPRARQVAVRRRALTGLSEFPNLHEELPQRRPHPAGARDDVEPYGRAFEVLRDEPVVTPVFLATLGPVAQHTARATFAANLLAAGGVDTVSAGATANAEDVVTAFRQCDPATPVVCLCGTDAAYADGGADLVAELREAGATHVVLAGRPGEKTLPVDTVDSFCAVGIDALDFLHAVREELTR